MFFEEALSFAKALKQHTLS